MSTGTSANLGCSYTGKRYPPGQNATRSLFRTGRIPWHWRLSRCLC